MHQIVFFKRVNKRHYFNLHRFIAHTRNEALFTFCFEGIRYNRYLINNTKYNKKLKPLNYIVLNNVVYRKVTLKAYTAGTLKTVN